MTYVPGPWNCDRAYVITPDNERITLIVPENGENEIARVSLDYTEEATKANARLIAAAPDLLEALKELLSWSQSEYHSSAEIDARAQRAIDKAEGK